MNSANAKVALVTGATRGVGKGVAVGLAAAGFSVQVTTQWECDPHDSCGAVAGQVWLETPPGGAVADPNSTVIIWVNPSG